MKSIRSFSFAAAFTVSVLTHFAGLANAQSSMQGQFTLHSEVNWEHTVVPAGDYEFSIKPVGGTEYLALQKINGSSLGFIVLLHPPESASSAALSELVLVKRGDCSFVSSMQLAKYGVSFDFAVPDEPAHSGKQIARTETVPSSTAR
jgi:hypothetical protein